MTALLFYFRQPKLSTSFHKGTVYRVAWGPAIADTTTSQKGKFELYSVGDGVILQHTPADLNARAQNVMEVIRKENSMEVRVKN